VIGARGGRGELRYAFNAAFGQAASQADVYAAVQPSISLVTNGVSATIMAYGQTGSGKSHTMLGPEVNRFQSQTVAVLVRRADCSGHCKL
jgi:Kinesin motor domain